MTKTFMNRRLFKVATVAAIPLVTLFCVAGLLFGDLGRAWEVFAGLRTPWGQSPWVALPLSIVGYLLGPAIVGLSVSSAVAWAVSRRVTRMDEAVRDLRRRLLEPGPSR